MEPVYTSEVGEEPEPSQCSFKSITPQDQLRKHDSPNLSCCCTNETTSGEEEVCEQCQECDCSDPHLNWARRLPGEHRVDIRPGQYTRRGGGGRRRPTTQQHDDLLLCTKGKQKGAPTEGASAGQLMRAFPPRLSEAQSVSVAPHPQPATTQP